jgi:hypothetical protein
MAHGSGELSGSVANINLPAGDVMLAAFEGCSLSEPGDGVLGRRVGYY